MNINCIMGQHRYRASDMEVYLAEKKPKSRVYRVIYKCYFCGKEKEELVEIPNLMDDPQRAYEQGVKDACDKYDEDFRMASEIRIAVGCNTAKECWELARKGDIQRVKHGKWEMYGAITQGTLAVPIYRCSECKEDTNNWFWHYCPNCGAKMDEVEE